MEVLAKAAAQQQSSPKTSTTAAAAAVKPKPEGHQQSSSTGKSRCNCGWKECKELRNIFVDLDPKGFGGPNYAFSFIKRGEEKIKHREAILSPLNLVSPERKQVLMQRECVVVARHHFDPRQIQLFNQNRRARSTPLTKEAMKQYTDVPVNPEYRIQATKNKKGDNDNDEVLYYHLPNYPLSEARLDAEALQKGSATSSTAANSTGKTKKASKKKQKKKQEKEKGQQPAVSKESTATTSTTATEKTKNAPKKQQTKNQEKDQQQPTVSEEKKQEEKERMIVKVQKHEERAKAKFQAMSYEEYQRERESSQQNDAEIQKLQAQIAALKKSMSEKSTALRSAKKREDHAKKKLEKLRAETNNAGYKEEERIVTLPRVNRFLHEYGGLSRQTITSDVWHNENKGAAKHLFGFETWEDMKKHIHTNFKDESGHAVNVHLVSNSITMDGLVKHEKAIRYKHKRRTFTLSSFEQCVATKLYLHRIPVVGTIALIMATNQNSMGRYVKHWTPQWKGEKHVPGAKKDEEEDNGDAADDAEVTPAWKKQKTSKEAAASTSTSRDSSRFL